MIKNKNFVSSLMNLGKNKELTDEFEDEILSMVSVGQEQGVLQENEAKMISNIFALTDKEAKDIVTNRGQVVALDCNLRIGEALEIILNNSYSRYPVYEEDLDHIIGILHLKDVVKAKFDASNQDYTLKGKEGLLREALFVPETKPVDVLFREMQAAKIQMAIVVDEYGQTTGLIAMEDILEELVGDIWDEHDTLCCEVIKKIDECVCEFDGAVLIEEAFDCMDLPDIEHEESTVGGYVFGLLGQVAKAGDKVEDEFCHYEVIATDNMRITRIKMTKKAVPTETEEEK